MNDSYERMALAEMRIWQKEMTRRPGLFSKLTRSLQHRVNRVIPEKVHDAITAAIRHTVQTVLTGSKWIAPKPLRDAALETREFKVRDRINFYRNTAAAEGAVTGAGGLLLGLADFPIWLSLKMKMLTDIAALYGHDTGNLKERIYLLHIFQLAFSGKQHRRSVFRQMTDWEKHAASLPEDAETFDWRSFQQEYRDYIDIAKLLQLVPGIGAFVGAYVNHKLTEKLGVTAMNAYRMRYYDRKAIE